MNIANTNGDGLVIRVLSIFFVWVGHETIRASNGNRYFFTKQCHHQTYQNYEQLPRTSQNSNLQSYS